MEVTSFDKYLNLLNNIHKRGIDKSNPIEVLALHNETHLSVNKICDKSEFEIIQSIIGNYLLIQEELSKYKTENLKLIEKSEELSNSLKVVEDAFDKATELAYTYRTQDDTLSCSSCPFDSIFDRCKERGLYADCARSWKEELLRQSKINLNIKAED